MLSSQPKAKCRGVYSSSIPYTWVRVKGYIQDALDRGSDYTLDEIFTGLCSSEMQLWVAETDRIVGALVTTIQTSLQCKYCLLLAAGGTDLDTWVTALPELEKWAKEKGCEEMRIYGRRGWARKLGYDVRYTALGKSI